MLVYTILPIIRRTPYMSDKEKLVHVMVVVPVIFEFVLTLQRLMVRSFSEHHESAAWVLLATALAGKSLASRFLVATMSSSAITFLGALHLPIISEDWRDRQLYRLIGWCCGTDQPEEPARSTADALSLDGEFKDPKKHQRWQRRTSSSASALSPDGKFEDPTRYWRNVSLRERYVQAEFIIGITFTFTTGFFIWWLDISLDGVNPPNAAAILTSIFVQLLGLTITHVGDVLYTEIVLCRPMLVVVHRNFEGYGTFLALLILYCCATTISTILPSTLGRLPRLNSTGDREPTWLFLTEDVVSALNVSAVCAVFPSARAFAQDRGC